MWSFILLEGWEDGVLGMKKGGKRLLAIPPELAYGDKASVVKRAYKGSLPLFPISKPKFPLQAWRSYPAIDWACV
jgi:hypothetical protein